MEKWHLFYTKPRKELLVYDQLVDRGFEVFFPYLQFDRGYGRGSRLDPVFPHYLFARVNLMTREASGLRWLPGMRTIVHFDGYPASVPDFVIDGLRKQIEPYQGKALWKSEWLYEVGQRVLVSAGPFEGFEAIFQKGLGGGERVQVLLDLAGTWTRAQLDVDHIKPVTKH